MKDFAELLEKLSLTNDPGTAANLLAAFFRSSNRHAERDEALKLLLGFTPKRAVTTKQLKTSASKLTGYTSWLIERSEKETGSFVSTLSLLLRSKGKPDNASISDWVHRISNELLSQETEIHHFILMEVSQVEASERLILLKLLTGTFKSPLSQNMVEKALALALGITPQITALRLSHLLSKNLISYQLLNEAIVNENQRAPAKFPEITLIDGDLDKLGDPGGWSAFGKKGGIEAQLVKCGTSVDLWSLEGEIITEKFPEIADMCQSLKGNIKIHGQIIPLNPVTTLDKLNSRFNKKNLTKNDFERYPAAFEIWETLSTGQHGMVKLSTLSQFSIISPIEFSNWTELRTKHKNCRKHGYSGILLQHKGDPEQYLFHKASSFSIYAVLTYLEFGGMTETGIKSMTFGVHKDEEIIPIGKIDTPFENLDCLQIAAFAKKNTIERFGPVRTINPELVFELYFDGVMPAPRRKSGLILSNLSIFRRIDGGLELVDSLDKIQNLM